MEDEYGVDRKVLMQACHRTNEIVDAIKATDYMEWLWIVTPGEGRYSGMMEQVYCMMKYEGGKGDL